ncbi:hypothetical protein PQG76_07370 [Corynebacterium falsenii]|uniref:hypothetical protein n=1 Tax=Corynebacterium falsenii TaxID=108486 RepID=UPI00234DBB4E|nr:hypothetical protein [Corynebacterium falsenii]MDC7104323.1 hypothetical protein [Corynebacterium falsenii]
MLNISYLTTLSIHTPGVHRRCSNLELAAEHCQNLGTALAGESPPTIAGNIFPGALAHLCTESGRAIRGHGEQLLATTLSIMRFADGVDNQDSVNANALDGAR